MNEPYVDAQAIATHLGGMSHLTILSWAKTGKIPGTKPGKKWLFKMSEVELALNPPAAPEQWATPPKSRHKTT